jgi:hypothetical protein
MSAQSSNHVESFSKNIKRSYSGSLDLPSFKFILLKKPSVKPTARKLKPISYAAILNSKPVMIDLIPVVFDVKPAIIDSKSDSATEPVAVSSKIHNV